MDNIPTEGSPAGDALAAMVVIAPFVAVLLGSVTRPLLLAFFTAIIGGFAVIGAFVYYAFDVAPGSGTSVGVMFFGSGAAILTVLMAALTSGSRALYKYQEREDAVGKPSGH